jgi:hypothetical protein
MLNTPKLAPLSAKANPEPVVTEDGSSKLAQFVDRNELTIKPNLGNANLD